MKTQLQLIAASAALTVLIWVYADRLGHATAELRVEVTVNAPPDVIPRIVGASEDKPQSLFVRVQCRGTNAAIQRVEQSLLPGNVAFQVSVPTPEDLQGSGPHEIGIRKEIARALRDRGLELIDPGRTAVQVTLDRLVAVPVEVEVDPGTYTEALDGKPLVQPRTVTMRMLESDRSQLGATAPRLMVPVADQLAKFEDTLENTFRVPLSSPWPGIKVAFDPPEVAVTARLKQSYETVSLSLIPVGKLLPWDWPADKYEIEFKEDADRLQRIDIRVAIGRSAVPTPADVAAYIPIDDRDLPPDSAGTQPAGAEDSWREREVRFHFLGEFSDVKIEGPPRLIRFRVKRRPTGLAPAVPATPAAAVPSP